MTESNEVISPLFTMTQHNNTYSIYVIKDDWSHDIYLLQRRVMKHT